MPANWWDQQQDPWSQGGQLTAFEQQGGQAPNPQQNGQWPDQWGQPPPSFGGGNVNLPPGVSGLYGMNEPPKNYGQGAPPPGTQFRVDTAVQPGGVGGSGGAPPAPQAGQWAPTNQGFLDWATQQYGADPTRGAGFVNAQAGGGLQNMLQAYSAATGNQANYLAGPSGDRVDFGQGVQDALTSGGQIWNAAGGGPPRQGGGGGGASFGVGNMNLPQGLSGLAGGGGGSGITMPQAPGYSPIAAPSPFSYQPSTLGQFNGPAPYQAPSPFSFGGQVPNAPNLQAQNVADPERLNYEKYTGLTDEQLKSDPSYKFRFDQGANAASNILAHSGALRTGNAAKALTDYGQNAASQEYAAADARARQNVQGNNANAYQFGNANIANQFNATQANNQNAFNFGNQNFQNALAGQAQGYGQAANTYGMNAATQQGAQNQNFNQALAAYGANQGAQNQNFNQALAAYGQNANTGLAYGQANQGNALANYQAQVAAQLGLGNLNLGYQNSNQNYALGMGNLGVSQGQLGLAQQGQNFNQGLQQWQQNYQSQVLDPWNMNFQLAQLGNPGAPNGQGNANAQSELFTGAGNSNAAGQVGAQNAWNGAWNSLGNLAGQVPWYLQAMGGGSGGNGLPGYSSSPVM